MERDSVNARRRFASGKAHDLIAPAWDVLEGDGGQGKSAPGGGNPQTQTGVGSLQEICRRLGVGSSGFLKQKEFVQVCKHFGLHSLKKKEQMKIFKNMDTDKDGLISLAELESGLHIAASIHSPSPVLHPKTLKHSQSQMSRPLSLSQSKGEKLRTSVNASYQLNDGGTWLFSSVPHSENGSARSEDVLDLWDKLGILNGSDILLSCGFNPQGRVNLSGLTAVLKEVLTDLSSSDPICLVALTGYQHELRHLRSALEQVAEEKKKLQLDLSQAKSHNSLLEIEIDETHSRLDTHWDSKLLDNLGDIKDTYWTIDTKYREQIRGLKSELENEREMKAAELSRIGVKLEEIEKKSSQERQQLLAMLASSQKEIEQQDQALADTEQKMFALSKQNENLKKDLQHKLQLRESAEDHKQAIHKQQHKLVEISAENKKLKDENDELITQLEQTQQALYLAQRRIELLTHRLPSSFVTTSKIYQDGSVPGLGNSSRDFQPEILDRRHINLRTELSQSELEAMVDSQLAKIEQAYKQALSALEVKHLAERTAVLDKFNQEKKSLISEQKKTEEILLAEQHRNLQTAFAQEKHDLVQKHENEKSHLNQQCQQEIAIVQERLLQALSQIEDSIGVKQVVHHLEMQVAKCREDIHHLENQQKPDTEAQLRQQEMTLRHEFEEQRKRLEEQRKLQEINNELKLNNLFERGVEGLTGKLREEFFKLVREQTDIEVRQTQAVLLNQLQKDRQNMVTAVDKEKCQINEQADSERKTLVAKYEQQIASLKTDLNEMRSRLESEKQMVSEMSVKYAKESIASENALETLRKTMERELLIELTRITESFESEKRELNDHKMKLEEKLTEMEKKLSRERQKSSDIDSLKETVIILKTEKKEMETVVEEMKEKLFHNYQTINAEREDIEVKLKAVRDEAESRGRMEGLVQGRQEGIAQGRKPAFEEGYRKGLNEGREDGYNKGKKYMDNSMSKSLEVMKALVESLKKEKAIMESELKQEVEKNDRCLQQLQSMDQLKRSFDLLLEEKRALEEKCRNSLTALSKEDKTEKDQLHEEIDQQKDQILKVQFDKKAFDSLGATTHQENKLISQMNVGQDGTPAEQSGSKLSADGGSLKEQMAQLCSKLQDTFEVQHELEVSRKDYDLLLNDKSRLEETVNMLKSKVHESDYSNASAQLTQLKTLSEDKQKLQALLDQTSNQLAKASTSMALAQSKFVRELELMKQKAKHMVEVESYTKLQINLVEHQRLVITLQDALRERESVIDKFIKQTDAEKWKFTKMMEDKVKDIQNKLDLTQDELTKYKEKYTQICAQMNQRNLILKDLYLENSDLVKTLADGEDKRKHLEKQKRQMNEKLDTYRKTIDTVYESLSR